MMVLTPSAWRSTWRWQIELDLAGTYLTHWSVSEAFTVACEQTSERAPLGVSAAWPAAGA